MRIIFEKSNILHYWMNIIRLIAYVQAAIVVCKISQGTHFISTNVIVMTLYVTYQKKR